MAAAKLLGAAATLLGAGEAARWAVIAAGSKGFFNYRHQADACHAYQIMKKSGIPEDNIILMMQDDVANSAENPFKGQLFNEPGENPPDVYAGCKIDYRGNEVTAKLFMDVLTGKAAGKSLKSGPEDHVFINFVDHGGVGIIEFPNGPLLHVKELSQTLDEMKQKKMFKQLVFYMEACESGSMFPNLTKDDKILAVTAANGKESSWGTYCESSAKVRGKNIGTCLGDLFSVSWMQDDDKGMMSTEKLKDQIAKVTELTNKSHVCVFGDTSFEEEPISSFKLGAGAAAAVEPPPASNSVDVRDIYLTQSVYAWKTAAEGSVEKQKAWKTMMSAIADRQFAEDLFTKMAEHACADVNLHDCVGKFLRDRAELKDMDCHYSLTDQVFGHCPVSPFHRSAGGWNGYNMKYSQVLVNFCEGQAVLGKSTQDLLKIIEKACPASHSARGAPELVV
eukprot:TRINITY_DN5468_c0_g1_i3.p1 TRINITY_DN5468_c0_g1~~TRINITY_DN5468_c0_g1_i3.p1  ORF type:complete len:480 (-),score=118.13 TRINITY_DN5468_c0_g1_i3:300-1646(-)